MEIFQPIIDFFNFIGTFITTIAEGLIGIASILHSVFSLVLSIARILPSPLYPCFITFISVYSTIFIFKLFRQG